MCLLHKISRCYHPPSSKVYISRHIIFDEICLALMFTSTKSSAELDKSHFTTFQEFFRDQNTLILALEHSTKLHDTH